jgi:hypothetical protein
MISTNKIIKKIPAIVVNAPPLVIKKPSAQVQPYDFIRDIKTNQGSGNELDVLRNIKNQDYSGENTTGNEKNNEITTPPVKNNMFLLLLFGGVTLYLLTKK